MQHESAQTRQLGPHFLRAWRKHRGLTQERAAELLGMDYTNLSKIERGKVPYSQALLEKAAEIYECTVADLLVRDPEADEELWSIWSTLGPAQKRQALRLIQALKDDV